MIPDLRGAREAYEDGGLSTNPNMLRIRIPDPTN